MPKQKQRGPGKPFQKGVSGNPKGRALKPVDARAIEIDARRYAKTYTRDAVDKLVTIMRGEPQPISDDENGKVVYARPPIGLQKEAAVDILNRGNGTPAQSVEIYDAGGANEPSQYGSALESLESSFVQLETRLLETGSPKSVN